MRRLLFRPRRFAGWEFEYVPHLQCWRLTTNRRRTMKRFWVSWNEPNRKGSAPWPSTGPEWWCTGYGIDYAIICAAVDADNEAQVKAVITKAGWKPRARDWRFIDEMVPGWRPPADRFPPRATFTTTAGGER